MALSIGTKSILFGVHQFVIHPLLVGLAWRRVYGRKPALREWVSIVVHDIGYWGKSNMDGDEGLLHPELGSRVMMRLCGEKYRNLVRYHSRSYARYCGAEPSMLCVPDKISMLLYPDALYLFLGRLSGEISEYKVRMGMSALSDRQWLHKTQLIAYQWAHQHLSGDDLARLQSAFSGRFGRAPQALHSR